MSGAVLLSPGGRFRAARTIIVLLSCLFLTATGSVAESAEPEGWWRVRTAHFTIFTDADPARVSEVGLMLERFREAFSRLTPALELNSLVPTKIFAFRDAESYAPYKTTPDPDGVKILGQFLNRSEGSFITLDAGSRLRSASAVVFHEFVHDFVRHNFPRAPLWFQEGLAEYYSTFWSDGERVIVGRPVGRHVAWLGRASELRLEELLAAKGHGPEHQLGGAAARFYAVSWALVHYLLSGDEERLSRVAEYLILLSDGEDSEHALVEAFGLEARGLERRLRKYIAEGYFPSTAVPVASWPVPSAVDIRPLAPAEVLFHTGELALQMGRLEQAERHFERALDLDPEQTDARIALALVQELQSGLAEAGQLSDRVAPNPLPPIRAGSGGR